MSRILICQTDDLTNYITNPDDDNQVIIVEEILKLLSHLDCQQ